MNALQRCAEVRTRIGVGGPQVLSALRTERRSRQDRHADLVEQPFGKSISGDRQLADVGKGVEPPAGGYGTRLPAGR